MKTGHPGTLCEGRLVSVTWVAVDRARVAFLARELTLEAGEIYLFDAFTLPEHRGERLQALLTARIVSHFRALGYRQAVSLIGPENRPNIASRERLGFRRTGTMGCIRLGRLRWDFFRGRRGYPIQAEEGNEPPTPRQG